MIVGIYYSATNYKLICSFTDNGVLFYQSRAHDSAQTTLKITFKNGTKFQFKQNPDYSTMGVHLVFPVQAGDSLTGTVNSKSTFISAVFFPYKTT